MDWKDHLIFAICVFLSAVISGFVMLMADKMFKNWGDIIAIPLIFVIGYGFGKLAARIVRKRHRRVRP